MKETMTIHKALSELKVLDARIESEITVTTFVVANKHSNKKINGVDVTEYAATVKDEYKSIRSLINRRNAIKRAVTLSNAVTKVKIGDKEYTVAEAIDMKNAGMNNYQRLLDQIGNNLKYAQRKCEGENGEKLDQRAESYLKTMFDSADPKNLSEEIEKQRKAFIESQSFELVDPINASDVLKELKDMTDTFMSDVDSALSVSNALTSIEVEYETL